ncbi:MAG TPA: hypothetical protein PKV01_11150 [Anaerolineales bacterium]|nr:hypothetical protein [Anaerolineales bacterium]
MDGSFISASRNIEDASPAPENGAANIPKNKRNRKKNKRGRKRIFNKGMYKRHFTSERSFAWIDKFRALLVRFDRRDLYFLNEHYIAFTMINIRRLISEKG